MIQYQDVMLEVFADRSRRHSTPGATEAYLVRVASSPAGEMSVDAAVPFTIDWAAIKRTIAQIEQRSISRPDLIRFGRQLADWLLPGGDYGPRYLWSQTLTRLPNDEMHGARLRLRLPFELAEIPWEYVYLDPPGGGDSFDGFLALHPRRALVRSEALSSPPPVVQLSEDRAIRIVMALAPAPQYPQLNLERERAILTASRNDSSNSNRAGLSATILESASLEEVRREVQKGAQVFHFAGHGTFVWTMGERFGVRRGDGRLIFADGRAITAETLMLNLRDNGLRLVVLSGCETARRGGVYQWGGIAPALAKAGIPAIVAYQFSILDRSAIAFSQAFYEALIGGMPIERALTAGRLAIWNMDTDGRDWGVPVLYLRAADGQLFRGVDDERIRMEAERSTEQRILVVYRDLRSPQKRPPSSREAPAAPLAFQSLYNVTLQAVNQGAGDREELRTQLEHLRSAAVPGNEDLNRVRNALEVLYQRAPEIFALVGQWFRNPAAGVSEDVRRLLETYPDQAGARTSRTP